MLYSVLIQIFTDLALVNWMLLCLVVDDLVCLFSVSFIYVKAQEEYVKAQEKRK